MKKAKLTIEVDIDDIKKQIKIAYPNLDINSFDEIDTIYTFLRSLKQFEYLKLIGVGI